MSYENISFQTSDNVTLRGWFIKSKAVSPPQTAPCLVMSHGFSALKEMDLDTFAEHFTTSLPMHCLVFDNRGFGESDHGPGQHRFEILPAVQISDIQDAITYAQSRQEVDADGIGIWGSSYSGGHVLWVGAVDKRVRVVLSQVPCVNGYENWNRLVRPDFEVGMNKSFQDDRLDRAAGKPPAMVPVVDEDPQKPSALPSPDSYQFFTQWVGKSNWENQVTLKSLEEFRAYNPSAHIHHISPTPLLMTVAEKDVVTPADLALEAFSRAHEPKQLHILPGGHFGGYSGSNFDKNVAVQTEFLRRHLLGDSSD